MVEFEERAETAAFDGDGLKLAAVTCINGFGHFGRVTNELDALTDRLPALDVAVFSSAKQAADTDSAAAQNLRRKGVRFIPDLLEPGVVWLTDPAVYDDGRLISWAKNLEDAPDLAAADLVLSDNLPGLLRQRPDAVLSGNFLWHDVLGQAYPDSPAVAEFVRHDSNLLRAHRPPMICVDALASPVVEEETSAVRVGWMLKSPERTTPKDPNSNKIVVFAGGVTAADEILTDAAERLAHDGSWDVHVQPKLHDKMSLGARRKAKETNNSYNTYEDTQLVVARPGVGTMTACVESETPIVAVHEPNNSEMTQNGRRIEELGIGSHLGTNVEEIITVLRALTQGAESERTKRNLQAQPRDGIAQAAQWLANRLVLISRS